MNIGGALGTAGKRSLGEFEWGETIVDICNSHLSEETQLLLSDTGNDAYAKIVALPDAIQVKLLSMDVGVLVRNTGQNKANYVRIGLVLVSVIMATVSSFATYQFNPNSSDEEKSQVTQTLITALQALLQAISGI